MNHSEIRIEIARRLAGLLDGTIKLPKELRPYQNETIAAMKRWLEDPKGSKRSYVSHATGLGKTLIFASVVTACAGLRTLVVVPSKVLIEQTARELYIFTGGMIGHVSSLTNIEDENGEVISMKGHDLFDVVLITDASLAKHGWKIAKEFDPHLVIRDECHWTYAEKRQKTMDSYPESVTIGFTATPDYLTNQARSSYIPVTLDNGQVLYAPEDRLARNHYGTCLDERTVRWGIEEGYLSPLAWGHVEFDFSLDGIGTELGEDGPDFRQEDLHALLSEKWQFMQDTVTELYKSGQYGLAGRQVFAVCHNVEAANQMADALRGIGVAAACITGKTRDIERNAILGAFKSGGIKFVSSVMVLREGWNAPNAEVCLMLRPTKSRVFYVQSMGRVLRVPEDGSAKVALVIDALYQNTAFAPLSAPVLFGYPGQEIGSGDILINALGDASKVKESPYRTGLVKPRLITIEAIEIERWADENGLLEIDGIRYRSVNGFALVSGISASVMRSRLKDKAVRPRIALGHTGHSTEFFPEETLCKLMEDLTSVVHRVDSNGFIAMDGVRYGTEVVILKEIGLTGKALINRWDPSKIRTLVAKDRSGRPTTVYSVEDVKALCADLLELKQAGKDGLLIIGKTPYATIDTIFLKISGVTKASLSVETLQGFRSIEARDAGGRKRILYSVADVQKYLKPLLAVPVADAAGMVKVAGTIYGTKKALAEKIGVQRDVISRIVSSQSIRTMQARSRRGALDTFYVLSDVRKHIPRNGKRSGK
ncbi:DEAD/DEAH box helicase family protein [Candidatus Uhrbacteria bacterium]|nr:DEAD/DEAH box helicase family protein [Candidatus Uhrbacteria bacterium]